MYTGNILDPIHGLIKLSEIEKWIIAQKPFNRLKRIKQNTFLYYVFPSSNHTRFEHSIGVMHLAHQIYLNSNSNYTTGVYKKNKYNSSDTEGFAFCSVSELLNDKEKLLIQELRIAALLHDVGHGPMSHKFDQYTLYGTELIDIINNDNELLKYKDNFKNLLTKEKNRIDHETVSCLFIIKLISTLKREATNDRQNFSEEDKTTINDLDVLRIIKMIEPKFSKEQIRVNEFDFSDFFNSIISSFPLDADRMDYLYRDSYFSGVKYGIYDLSRILMSFIPIKIDDKITLGIKESGIDSVIRFIQSRTHLYNQVYFHKTNRAANIMLDFACRNIEQNSSVIDASNYNELENFYWKNSDEIFLWYTLNDKITDPIGKEILDELLTRKLWKRVFQHKIVITNSDDRKEIASKINNIKDEIKNAIMDLESKGIFVGVDNFPNKVFKDYEKSKLMIAKKNENGYTISKNWKRFNRETEILDCEIHMFRIYLRRQFSSPKEFISLKKQVLDRFDTITSKLLNLKGTVISSV